MHRRVADEHQLLLAIAAREEVGDGHCAVITYDPESGPISSDTHGRMDQDVRAILETSYARVLECVRLNRPALEALADALIARETLNGAEAIAIMTAAGLGSLRAA